MSCLADGVDLAVNISGSHSTHEERLSRVVTCVGLNGEEPRGRNQFTWILFYKYKNIKIALKKDGNKLVFKVEWPDRKSCQAQLGVESQQTTTLLTAQHSPRQQPIYLPEEKLGRGSFGTVYKAVDVSTGYEYAVKMFHGGNWKKEVEILKSVSHEYIVEFVDFSKEQALLVMEYLPLGNLAFQDFITEEETLKILCQGLQALKYLHSHSPPLAHQDIKPENIFLLDNLLRIK